MTSRVMPRPGRLLTLKFQRLQSPSMINSFRLRLSIQTQWRNELYLIYDFREWFLFTLFWYFFDMIYIFHIYLFLLIQRHRKKTNFLLSDSIRFWIYCYQVLIDTELRIKSMKFPLVSFKSAIIPTEKVQNCFPWILWESLHQMSFTHHRWSLVIYRDNFYLGNSSIRNLARMITHFWSMCTTLSSGIGNGIDRSLFWPQCWPKIFH